MEEMYNVVVQSCDLFIDSNISYLVASPGKQLTFLLQEVVFQISIIPNYSLKMGLLEKMP
jgi:hypothetical protein